ncbi:D-alanyl-D-alanine carboxypeptidase/D-alanyl-D-alanine-endopeptidase [Cytobacillus sp. Hz8]|uniref:D-alanyl-D-alanine carboxypeptidase/D-alanyl-D-alanine endopeptidase n=1 Tax=Cytobacillus sp. Hz8 TaxID=3347168 RepID=UPI0035DCEE91
MKNRFHFIICFQLLLFFSFIPVNAVSEKQAKPVASTGSWKEELDQLIQTKPTLNGASIGISVRSGITGELLYQHQGADRFIPASNLKLITAATALSTLGEEHTFFTELHTDGKIRNNQLHGNLYLRGRGDPTILFQDFQRLAKELHQKGVHEIEGDIIGDDTWFDDIRYSIDLPWSDEGTYYGAQVSALTASPDQDFDAGTVILTISPAKWIRGRAKITVSPENHYVKIINKAKTVSSDHKTTIKIHRKHGSNAIEIIGNIPIKRKSIKETIAVWNPTQYALSLFKQALYKNEINIKGKIKVEKTPVKSQILATRESIPLKQLLIPFMKLSNNGHAEILTKEMGRMVHKEGSWKAGINVMQNELHQFGVHPENLILRDGSGISHINAIPPNEITQLLYSIQKEKWFDSFKNALPVAGESKRMVGGTLRNRMKAFPLKGNVFAKTGSLTSVSSLSGYVLTQRGDTLIFSILMNQLKDESTGKVIEDEIIQILSKLSS